MRRDAVRDGGAMIVVVVRSLKPCMRCEKFRMSGFDERYGDCLKRRDRKWTHHFLVDLKRISVEVAVVEWWV